MITRDFSAFSFPLSELRRWVENSQGNERAIYLRGPVPRRLQAIADERLAVALQCHALFGALLFQQKVTRNDRNEYLYIIQPLTPADPPPSPDIQALRMSRRA